MFMSAADYRETLRRQSPNVFLHGRKVESVADEEAFAPGIAAIGVTYDYTLRPDYRPLAQATQTARDVAVSRLLHINESTGDLLAKLEYVRLLCQETGCAQRYLTHDGLNALHRGTWDAEQDTGTDYHQRFLTYLARVQDEDLVCGVAMTDAKGDRSRRPHEQANPDAYVRIRERRGDGIVLSGTKAIVTSAPYVHELLVLPGRQMGPADSDFAVACAVPLDAEGVTIIAKPAGRPGARAAEFSNQYGQSVAVVVFRDVFVPWERVFIAGETEHAATITRSYATHHRQSCIAARAGFGDLLIGAGAMMIEANGLDMHGTPHLREAMVQLIKTVEGFYACGVAASVYGIRHASGAFEPEPVFANIGKLLLATQIYDMHRLAHEVSGGLVVALPGPDEDHNPETAGDLAAVLGGRDGIPYAQRARTARFIEDLTASETGGWYSLISLHGGGSPEAMKREIMRTYPIGEKTALVRRLLDRGVLADSSNDGVAAMTQPGRCCPTGCEVPEPPSRRASRAAE